MHAGNSPRRDPRHREREAVVNRAVRYAAIAVATALVAAIAACGPANGSPNCPPGQWYVETPGAGWSCMSDPGPPPTAFTPAPTGSAS